MPDLDQQNQDRVGEAQQRLADATDAVQLLNGARRVAAANGDGDWLREILEAFPDALSEQCAASDALRDLVVGEAA